MADLRHILDSSLEAKQRSRVQHGSAARRTLRLLCWKRNAMSRQNLQSWVCASSLCKICLLLGITARQLSSHCIISSVRAVIYAAAIAQGTIVMKHGV